MNMFEKLRSKYTFDKAVALLEKSDTDRFIQRELVRRIALTKLAMPSKETVAAGDTEISDAAQSEALKRFNYLKDYATEVLTATKLSISEAMVVDFIKNYTELHNIAIRTAMSQPEALDGAGRKQESAQATEPASSAAPSADKDSAVSVPIPQRVMSNRMKFDEALSGEPVVAAPSMTPDLMRIKRATNTEARDVTVPEVPVVSGTPVSEHSRPVGTPLHGTVEEPRFWNGPDKVPMPTLGQDFDEMK
jgi:hypothetical protein